MSLLAQFIGTFSAFLLVSCLSRLTTEVHAQAASDVFWMDMSTKGPLEESTSADNLEGKEVTTTPDTHTTKAKGCSLVPRLDFAQPRDEFLGQTTFPKGSKVLYNCRPGYLRVPGAKFYALCMDDGSWSLPENLCIRKSCGNPGDVENGEMQVDDFFFGSKVTYTCNTGYKMVTKRNYRVCQADGSWSNVVPVCEAQLCPQPADITNGAFNPIKEEYAYLDSVRYFCNRNLALIGESTISCTEEGQWSSKAPECRLVQCARPIVRNARMLSGTSGPYSLNSVVRFRCSSDYILTGSDTVKCNENSEWEPALPKCLDTCWFAPVIEFAHLLEPNQIKFLEGTTATYKCKEGYNPVPGANNVLTCLGKEWTRYDKFCTPVSCGHPGTINNGRIIEDGSFYFGSRITFVCDTGYKIKDRNYRECQADRSWSFPIPECTVVTCPEPDISLGTSVTPLKTQYQYGDTLTLSCSEGYLLTGATESVCNLEGRWHPVPSSCKGICDAPPELEFATLSQGYNKTFVEDQRVHYICKNGYFRNYQYDNNLTCLGNYEWSPYGQFCTPISCGPPEGIRNGEYEVKDFLFGSEAVYKCKKGYKMVSENSPRKCLATGKWSGPVPRCQIQTCPAPEDLQNGSYNNKKRFYVYQDSVTYKCSSLTLVGEASVSCTAEGKWTSGAPECKAVCKSLPELQYGELTETYFPNQYFEVGTTLKYKCRPGYVFVENKGNEITCLDTLKWSEPEQFCKRLKCKNPENIAHGQMHFENLLFESTVNYTCMPGYTMISRINYRQCQADGTWSGTPPVCGASICDKIWELQEEARRCTSTPDEWIKYLQVHHLYLQIENLKLDIEIKKKKLIAEKPTTWHTETDH